MVVLADLANPDREGGGGATTDELLPKHREGVRTPKVHPLPDGRGSPGIDVFNLAPDSYSPPDSPDPDHAD
jgi:hypothetical protein